VKETESQIVSAICDYLAARRHFFYRSNNLPVFDSTRQAFRAMPKHAKKGIPDIILIKAGKFTGLEVKTAEGRLSEHQVEFARGATEAGAEYHVVRSIDDVQRLGL
jgi:hypothetical protein